MLEIPEMEKDKTGSRKKKKKEGMKMDLGLPKWENGRCTHIDLSIIEGAGIKYAEIKFHPLISPIARMKVENIPLQGPPCVHVYPVLHMKRTWGSPMRAFV